MEQGRGRVRAFAALALGLVGRAIAEEGGVLPEREICAPLRGRFRDDIDARARGAYALASGLVGDPSAAGPLVAELSDRCVDKRLRGSCALALGMIGGRGSLAALRETLRDDADRELRLQCAAACGLLGDAAAVDDLVAMLRNPDSSYYELGTAALALGRLRDERAVDGLLEIATDARGRFPDLTRALAVVALGETADPHDVPALARVATDVNYRAHVAAITELLTML
jgi:HEAT repeat protein